MTTALRSGELERATVYSEPSFMDNAACLSTKLASSERSGWRKGGRTMSEESKLDRGSHIRGRRTLRRRSARADSRRFQSSFGTRFTIFARSRAIQCGCLCAVIVGTLLTGAQQVYADLANHRVLGEAYEADVRPLLERYCYECHGADEVVEGDVNLAAIENWLDAKKHSTIWHVAAEMLANDLMPPEGAEQPTADEQRELERWLGDFLKMEARSRAGDRGVAAVRRLSNAEYTYTLRDLTGIDSLDPAREFPADGAAGEGFTNAASALAMSPALFTKYLDAAKEVSRHAVLLPDGFRFSRHSTSRDWTDEILARIREYYGRFTVAGGGSKVNLQGIEFETNQGGVLPVEQYLRATLVERESLTAGRKTIAAAAREHGLNAKYFGILWAALTETEPSRLLDDFRNRWRDASPDDAPALVGYIAAWQKSLWKLSSVGLIGRKGGPTRWIESVDPVTPRHELRFRIPEHLTGDVTLTLVSSDAGDGNASDFVIWKAPRLVAEGQSDLPLRDIALGEAEDKAHNDESDYGDTGLKPEMFGRHPNGRAMEPADLCVQAPFAVTIRLPANVAAGHELAATGVLEPETGAEGSVQLAIVLGKPQVAGGLLPGEVQTGARDAEWTSGSPQAFSSIPVLITEGSAAERRFRSAFEAFRQLFPAVLCYTKIVPVDEVISVTLFYREDDHLMRLMLDETQARELDRLWDELHFVSADALASVDAFAQLLEFATQDADPTVFEPMRQPIADRAAAFRQRLVGCEPAQVKALVDFASLVYRRPLAGDEASNLNGLYERLRKEEFSHEDAFRLTLARVLVSPAFLYRIEKPFSGSKQGPVSDWELASRLSYFLWASQPDAELRRAAEDGQLHEPDVLDAQMRRMLRDDNIRRLAAEFACQWLQINDFQDLDEKSEQHFPMFAQLRDDMAEESMLFFTDLFENNGSVLDILDADYTFLNKDLAQHYNISDVVGSDWRRVEGVKKHARGGILAHATVLAKQSGASRTSPVLRGTWISEVLLGERLPNPPKGVPPLPDDEAATDGMTMRQLVEKHTSDAKCSVCHERIDPYGFSLEAFDAIGRYRSVDLGGRPVDDHVIVMDGSKFEGLDGLRDYLLTQRRGEFVRQFCRKLLGYALGRSVLLSDEPLLDEMQDKLAANGYTVDVAVSAIVQSRQFREIRGREAAATD